jgi:hypothetical protein
MFFKGYLTLDLDSADVFRGIRIFCRFFALQDLLSNRPLKKVWADRPTAVRFRVNVHTHFSVHVHALGLFTLLYATVHTNKNLQYRSYGNKICQIMLACPDKGDSDFGKTLKSVLFYRFYSPVVMASL